MKEDNYCIIHLFDKMEAGAEPITNEMSCILLTLTSVLLAVPSHLVVSPVSIVHQCSNTCKFSITRRTMIERESVEIAKMMFNHDWSNRLYCLNRYCMNNDD